MKNQVSWASHHCCCHAVVPITEVIDEQIAWSTLANFVTPITIAIEEIGGLHPYCHQRSLLLMINVSE